MENTTAMDTESYNHTLMQKRRKEFVIPLKLLDASRHDNLLHICIQQYLHSDISYVDFLEKLAIAQVESRRDLEQQLIENINNSTPNHLIIKG